MRVAIQGQAGSFHEMAAIDWFGDDITTVPADSFRGVFRLLEAADADCAVIAIENSLYGSINEVYDLLQAHSYPIVGEVHLKVEHQLIGFDNTQLSSITKVYSQGPALAQCANWLDEHLPHAELIEHHDTAESVAYTKQLGDSTCAAIASSRAAQLHDMPILASNIHDHSENYTRFLVLQPNAHVPQGANRASLVLTTSHQPGALAKALTLFADAGINLSKLQSRPIVGSPWNYKFYIVVETAGTALHEVITKITSTGGTVEILGEYVSTAGENSHSQPSDQ